MAGVRIRWRGVARVAAILVVGLIAVRLLPGFLRAPEPPPLAADVGLPKATPVTEVPRGGKGKPATVVPTHRAADRSAPARRKHRRRSRPRKSSTRSARDMPASTAVIASKHQRARRHHHRHAGRRESTAERPPPSAESIPPPVAEYVPAVTPEPILEAPPEPPPTPSSTPGDGSEEFAPH
jgi:hypothetical protein